jgi:hypothetical protein
MYSTVHAYARTRRHQQEHACASVTPCPRPAHATPRTPSSAQRTTSWDLPTTIRHYKPMDLRVVSLNYHLQDKERQTMVPEYLGYERASYMF